ncbi:MAG: hypothetical protein AAFX40_01790 [Cyanobacteria bacterium J06639_1]
MLTFLVLVYIGVTQWLYWTREPIREDANFVLRGWYERTREALQLAWVRYVSSRPRRTRERRYVDRRYIEPEAPGYRESPNYSRYDMPQYDDFDDDKDWETDRWE